jgi:hypothetical protein
MVHCGSSEGRHTAANIAEQLDKAIKEIPGLPTSVYKVCTSDNAANMLSAIPALTEEINEGLGCIDHLLNIVVTECLAIPELAEAVLAFKKLSSRTHKTSLDQQRIKKECNRLKKDESGEPGMICFDKCFYFNQNQDK